MTVIAMGLGYAISVGDPTSLSANLQVVSNRLPTTLHPRWKRQATISLWTPKCATRATS